MKKIISQINTKVREKTALKPNTPCICGISGGQDSVLLFFILLHLKKQWNLHIHLLHFHHFWQQKNFFSSSQLWNLAFSFQNPLYINLSTSFLKNEKKARDWRQRGLKRISSLEKCTTLLTGHTASDRIETSFWHLIRGTSPQGFLSLKWQTTLPLQSDFFNFPIFFHSQKKFKNGKNTPILKFPTKTNHNQRNQKFTYKKKNTNTSVLISSKYQKFFDRIEKKKTNFQSYFTTEKYFDKEIKHQKLNTDKCFDKKTHHQKYTFVTFNLLFSKKKILRPLLFFHRTDVTLLAKKYLVPVMYDSSNEKICWSRNRIRSQLVPILRFFFNPHIDSVFNHFLEISIQEECSLDFLMQKILYFFTRQSQYIKIFRPKNTQTLPKGKFTSFCTNKFLQNDIQKLPKSLQKRFVNQVFSSYTKIQLNRIQIDQLLSLFEKTEKN